MRHKLSIQTKLILASLSLCCLAISGCQSQPKEVMWRYNPAEQSLNAPMPFSAYVYVTQQVQDDQLNYVTCNPNLCPAWGRKTLIAE